MLARATRPIIFRSAPISQEGLMQCKEYVVTTSSGRWWIMEATERLGPFVSRQVATEAAIRSAKLDFKAGRHARVSLDEPPNGAQFLYDSTL
jgi:hypothetical protein